MSFRCSPLIFERLIPEWIHWLTKTKSFWALCDHEVLVPAAKTVFDQTVFWKLNPLLPPISEQRRIVVRIEELAAQIDEARGLRQQATDETGKVVLGRVLFIFQKAIMNGTLHLESAATLERGKFSHRPRNEPRFFGGVHPWIQIGEIEGADKYIRRWTQTLNEDGLAISKKFPRGTVLVSIAATIGSVESSTSTVVFQIVSSPSHPRPGFSPNSLPLP